MRLQQRTVAVLLGFFFLLATTSAQGIYGNLRIVILIAYGNLRIVILIDFFMQLDYFSLMHCK